MAEGLLVEAHESDLSVANEVTQVRVTEALTVGAETYEGELEMLFIETLPAFAHDGPVVIDAVVNATQGRLPSTSQPRMEKKAARASSASPCPLKRGVRPPLDPTIEREVGPSSAAE